jgi:hypothetical protein
MAYCLAAVTSKETAESFLVDLQKQGNLYHPEDSAFDCLCNAGLSYDALVVIDRNMKRCFDYLPDPCETALQLLNATFMQLPNHKPGYCWENVAPLGKKPIWREVVAPWNLQSEKIFGYDPDVLLSKQYR